MYQKWIIIYYDFLSTHSNKEKLPYHEFWYYEGHTKRRAIMPMSEKDAKFVKIMEFCQLQWIMFVGVYWGLRLVGEKTLSQNVSFFITLLLVTSIGWLVIAIIGRDKQVAMISQRVMVDTSISLIAVLLSEILVILWVFIEFDGIQIEPVLYYLCMRYFGWITLPIICLIWDKKMRQGVVAS